MNTTTYRRPLTDAERREALEYLVGNPDAMYDWSLQVALGAQPPVQPKSWWERFIALL